MKRWILALLLAASGAVCAADYEGPARLRFLSVGQYEVWTESGQVIPLEHEFAELQDVPLEEPILVDVEDDRLVAWRPLPVEGMRDEFRKDIALVHIVLRDTATEYEIERTSRRAAEIQNHLRWAGNGAWDVTVTPYVLADPLAGTGLIAGASDAQDYVHRINPGNEHNYWHLSGPGCGGNYAGIAYVNSNIALTCNGQLRTFLHEQGHNFGSHHHNSGESGRQEYGGYSWMGNGWNFAAPQQFSLFRTLPPEARGPPGRVYLVHPQSDALTPQESKIVYWHDGQFHYAASLFGSTVKVDASSHDQWVRPWVVASLNPGDRETVGGQPITFRRLDQGVAEVVIGADTGGEWPDLPKAPVARLDASKAGIWHAPGMSHQGFQVHVLDGQVVAYWLTWDGTGQPRWFLLEGPALPRSAHLRIWGQNPFIFRRELAFMGEARLYWPNHDQAEITFHLSALAGRYLSGRHRIPLERLANADAHALAGVWESGTLEGLSVTVAGDTTAAYYLGWDGWRQDWLMLVGPTGGDLAVYDLADGFPYIQADARLDTLGPAQLAPGRISGALEGTLIKIF